MHFRSAVAVLLVTLGLAGCSKDSPSPVGTPPPVQASLTVSPGDGETGVRLDATIAFAFAKPVDRSVVERNFHLVGQRAMADSVCPGAGMMTHEMMTHEMMMDMMRVMADSTTMGHMERFHSAQGRFEWNGDSTECVFRPDSMMTPQMQYMIHMGPQMMQMMKKRMGDTGMTDGHGSGVMSDHMFLHFTTMDTTGTGGGHGHH